MQSKQMIKSPLNYTGGKFKLLPQILPLFPNNIDCFYDIFCGGANVAINVDAKKTIALDINSKIINLYNYFLTQTSDQILSSIEEIIYEYKLSDSQTNGYDYYKCDSSTGLGNFNRSAYDKLKKDYNNNSLNTDNKTNNCNNNLLFYVLIVYGFNNQIRFNQKGGYNIPIGKRDFNQKMKNHLKTFVDKARTMNIEFKATNFNNFLIDTSLNNFVYADPPYLISTATYNESNGWDEKKEKALLEFLLDLHNKKIKFALSNVIEHKNKKNELLAKWIDDNKFIMHPLNFSYSNSSYQGKDKESVTKEILVTNY